MLIEEDELMSQNTNGSRFRVRKENERRKKDLARITDELGKENGRGDRIRTYDPLVPNQMRYQTALRPDRSPGE